MVMEFDKHEWKHDAQGLCRQDGPVRPNWQGLQARLFAARAARRVLPTDTTASRRPPFGSFDDHSARAIVAFGCDSAFVNPNDSADRNAGDANGSHIAAQSRNGERG